MLGVAARAQRVQGLELLVGFDDTRVTPVMQPVCSHRERVRSHPQHVAGGCCEVGRYVHNVRVYAHSVGRCVQSVGGQVHGVGAAVHGVERAWQTVVTC